LIFEIVNDVDNKLDKCKILIIFFVWELDDIVKRLHFHQNYVFYGEKYKKVYNYTKYKIIN